MVELAWGVEVSSQCRARVEVWCRGVEARAQQPGWRRMRPRSAPRELLRSFTGHHVWNARVAPACSLEGAAGVSRLGSYKDVRYKKQMLLR